MSRTPTGDEEASEEYRLGWAAINKLVDQGFSWSGNERNRVFLNTGPGRFADASVVSGLAYDDDGRSVATVDWDFDGDLDLVVTNRTGPRLRFLRNEGRGGGFVQLKLAAVGGNRGAIGARVELRMVDPEGAPLVATRRAGSGYQAQSSAWLHFGLGEEQVQGAQVRWPDGSVEVFQGIAAGGRYLLVQGSGKAEAWTPPAEAQVLAPAPPPAAPSSAARVVLTAPVPMPRIGLESGDGRSGTLFGVEARARAGGRTQRPLLIQLWASWCAPCAVELGEFTTAAPELAAAGLEVLALNLEQGEARAKASTMLERIGWPHPSAFAPETTVEVLDALQGAILRQSIRIPVPSSFLVDGSGNLVAFYLGRVEPEQVLADLALIELDSAARLAAATPFPGQWFDEPPTESPVFLEGAFRDRGFPEVAREYQPGWIHLTYGRAFAARGQAAEAEDQYRRAIAVGPYVAEGYVGLGQALRMQGRADDAVDAFERALERVPGNQAVQEQLEAARRAADGG
ncbi:MAG: ASPIC/UnbV domain-containing protein [Planctomycetota bacterium]